MDPTPDHGTDVAYLRVGEFSVDPAEQALVFLVINDLRLLTSHKRLSWDHVVSNAGEHLNCWQTILDSE